MPIYEFNCSECGHVFEELVFRAAEVKELECPKCGAAKVKQQMSTFAISAPSAPVSGCSQPGGPSAGCGGPGGFS